MFEFSRVESLSRAFVCFGGALFAIHVAACGADDNNKPAAEVPATLEPGIIAGTARPPTANRLKNSPGTLAGYSLKSGQTATNDIDGANGHYRVNVGPGHSRPARGRMSNTTAERIASIFIRRMAKSAGRSMTQPPACRMISSGNSMVSDPRRHAQRRPLLFTLRRIDRPQP